MENPNHTNESDTTLAERKRSNRWVMVGAIAAIVIGGIVKIQNINKEHEQKQMDRYRPSEEQINERVQELIYDAAQKALSSTLEAMKKDTADKK